MRDPRATRLLEFKGFPGWVDKGSRFARRCHRDPHSKKYRHLIRRVVTKVRPIDGARRASDCNWPLKIRYDKLPNLEYLVLDLYEFKLRCVEATPPGLDVPYVVELVGGAKSMKGLKLKELVVVGLLEFLPHWKGPRLKEMVELLFRQAMAPDGEIKIYDSVGIEW